MARRGAVNGSGKRLASQQSVNAVVKSICDIMRRSNCAGALQYVPELTWILFLRILDERETREAEAAEAVGAEFTPSLEAPYRWQDWASPDGPKRKALGGATLGAMFSFVHEELLPQLKGLKDKPNATARQKVISEIMSGVERTRIDTERNFLDVVDKVHEISADRVDPTHVFTLSQVYEGLLLSLKPGGRCGIVLDEGVLFRTNETAFVQTKRKLLDDCDLWCIVSLPAGAFVNAGAGVKVGKKSPLTLAHFDELFRLRPGREDSERSWTVSRDEIEARGYDLKAVSPHAKIVEDTRTPEELLDVIEAKGREVSEAIATLRGLLKGEPGATP